MIVATIPVGLAGLLFDHEFRVLFGKPVRAAIFLIINGLILYAGERFRTKSRWPLCGAGAESERQHAGGGGRRRHGGLRGGGHARQRAPARPGVAAHASGQRAVRQQEASRAVQADRRLTTVGYLEALLIGSAQILALLAGISRDGVMIVAGMFRGLSREDAARFAFLLATPVILAAGRAQGARPHVHYGKGIHGPILVGSILSGVGAYVSVRFLVKYFRTRTLTPFAIYCVLFGIGSIIYL